MLDAGIGLYLKKNVFYKECKEATSVKFLWQSPSFKVQADGHYNLSWLVKQKEQEIGKEITTETSQIRNIAYVKSFAGLDRKTVTEGLKCK